MLKNKLFKWIGGKKWLAPELNRIFNDTLSNQNKIEYYIEPFAGGLGSFLYTLETLKEKGIKKIYLNDVNQSIIGVYQNIAVNPVALFESYWAIEQGYANEVPPDVVSLHKIKDKLIIKEKLKSARDYFEIQKKLFNSCTDKFSLEASSLFLFLIKHAFNGVYRENSKGHFNTPYNWEACLFKKEQLQSIINEYSDIFNTFEISFNSMDVFDFLEVHKDKRETSLLYLDPPYLNESIAENKYHREHFGYDEQRELLALAKEFSNVVFSNHYLELFKTFCDQNNFKYQEVFRSGNMNSDPARRGQKVSEILAYKKTD